MASISPDETSKRYRALPSVATAVEFLRGRVGEGFSSDSLVNIARARIEAVRREIELGLNVSRESVLEDIVSDAIALQHPRLSPVLNATGILIHTNLGRAPVSAETAAAMAQAASSYVPLEIEIDSGERGDRMAEIAALMRLLTGGESTLIVNNNAAAVLLTLSALAKDQEVIVSRSEAVEIGGGFRIPDVMRQSGATLVEVGTTNRTYATDYRDAITERTAALLKVHQSNFRIEGFTAAPALEELVEVAARSQVSLIDDLGSGALIDVTPFGLGSERTIQESIAAGVTVTTASGDKLLGGPQAGIIAGKAAEVSQIAKHPLARAVRADKTCLAGIARTLRHYLHGDAVERIPVWRMIAATPESLKRRAESLAAELAPVADFQVVECASTTGGGSLPGSTLSSWGLALDQTGAARAHELAADLRTGSPGVFGRVQDDRLVLDLRTILPEDDTLLLESLRRAIAALTAR